MNKNITKKIAVIAGGVALLTLAAVVSLAFAQNALTVSCTPSVSGNMITWSAAASGGSTPYSFAWTGDSSVAGNTSTSITATYLTNGTYYATTTVTDASSSVASANCSATVTANVVPPATSTLDVYVSVNNTAGGSATPSNFNVTVSGANASPNSFVGSSAGTSVVVNASTTYTVGASSFTNYTASESGNCTGPIAAGATNSCTVTETYVPPTTPPTPTSTVPRVNLPMLTIGANGQFLSRGMTVTSVGTNSFQATVWGITYTVNWSGTLNSPFEFWFRFNKGTATTTPATQLAVGDEVGVAGMVTSSSPLTVNASVVRDYSITITRPITFHADNGIGNGGENNGVGNGNGVGTSSPDFRGRVNALMSQFQNLQKFFNDHFGGGKH